MNILGINAFHGDSSASIISDGQLVAAVEEERFRRIKHWAGFPVESIKCCLAEANLSLADIHIIAINQNWHAHFWKKLRYIIQSRPDLNLILQRIKNRKARGHVKELISQIDGKFNGNYVFIEHHLAHLSSAFHVSPFNEAVALSIDGFGDFASSAWGAGRGLDLSVDNRIYFPHSLGIFYEAMTQYLGFKSYGDEYKVMGLAPYGNPRFMDEMRKIVHLIPNGKYSLNLDYFRHAQEKIEYKWNNCAPEIADLFTRKLEDLIGPPRNSDQPLTDKHRDIAASVQLMYEEAFFNLLNVLYEKYKLPNLVLSGGCAMNSVANGKIYQQTKFEKVYVQAAAGDAGGAIGAAMIAGIKSGAIRERNIIMEHAYWGPYFNHQYIDTLIKNNNSELVIQNCIIEKLGDKELIAMTAKMIASGNIIGWFQGRMEWGPRALGNRSILCDPRRADMKDILNKKIKRRESFRPFAPSILRESVSDWFETDDDVPFMMKVFKIREHQRHKIPAVTHIDGSGRLQTVLENTNPLYYQLIKSFADITGIPILLNTSFNENEPIVCKPEEALDCFLRTKMDVLVLGNFVIQRTEGNV